MSDYLTRQVERSVSPAAAVQPRLWSAYEVPRTPREPAPKIERDPDLSGNGAAEDERSGLARLAQLESLWGRLSEGRASRRVFFPEREHGIEPREADPSTVLRPQASADEPSAHAAPLSVFPDARDGKNRMLSEEQLAGRPPTRATVRPSPTITAPESRRPFPASPTPSDDPKTGAREAVRLPADKANERASGTRRQAASEPLPTPSGDRMERAPAPAPPAPVVPAAVVVARQPVLARREPTGERPSIQVTIGRVEVRATAAPAAKRPRPQAGKSVLSLDEYLRGRAAEGAR